MGNALKWMMGYRAKHGRYAKTSYELMPPRGDPHHDAFRFVQGRYREDDPAIRPSPATKREGHDHASRGCAEGSPTAPASQPASCLMRRVGQSLSTAVSGPIGLNIAFGDLGAFTTARRFCGADSERGRRDCDIVGRCASSAQSSATTSTSAS
ncbi:MAG TPA: hypothetical protein VHB21_08255 [Minicystis sp.]|nr:hypothetical protein [Minicystis sp.]